MTARITFFVALLLLAAAAASAQTASWIRVTVPFSFGAASINCPAGEYTINIDRQTGQVMLNSEHKAAVLLTSTDPRPADRGTYLRFRHFGQRWVLQEVVAGGTAQRLNPSKLETEYAKAKPVEEKIVAATVNK